MSGKLISLTGFILILGLAGSATANDYTDAGPTHFFDDADNWIEGVPSMSNSGGARWANMTVDDTICIVDANQNVSANGFYPGCYGGDNEFYMTGGSLTVWFFNVGRGRDPGSRAYAKITGGVLTAERQFAIPLQFDLRAPNFEQVVGHLDLHGGEIRVTDVASVFLMGDRTDDFDGGVGTMDITEGKLIVFDNTPENPADPNVYPGAMRDRIQEYIDNGWITAYGGKGEFNLDFNETNPEHTTLTAFETIKAYWPTPKDGAGDVQPTVVLAWWPGTNAATEQGHDVYFGTDASAVAEADHSSPEYKGRQDPNVYPATGALDLDLNTTYYWRIDEISEPNIWKGRVWSFTTANYFCIDEMESYDYVAMPGQPGSSIWYTWRDGAGWVDPPPGVNGNGTGSVVDIRTDIVHAGNQSMKFDYDNDGTNDFGSGLAYYSELTAAMADLSIASDWTRYGAKSLELWFRGTADNDVSEQMWIALEDTSGTSKVVPYDGMMSDIALQEWILWRMPLDVFTNVDMSSIEDISIGFGDRGNSTTPGGEGTVYFDAIRVYPCRPGGLPTDLNGDCVVDYADLAALADRWLEKQLWP